MSALDPHPGDEGPDVTAGEYVLGVLDTDARTAFATRLAGEPALRREVEAWEARLGPWVDAIAPETPPSTLWPAVERALGPVADAGQAAAEASGGVVVVLQRRLGRWRAATAVSLALAAALAVAAVVPIAVQPPMRPSKLRLPFPMQMASLSSVAGGKAAMFMATYDPDRDELMVAPTTAEDHPGHVPELWLIRPGDKPVPLGMAGFGAPVRLRMAAIMLAGEGRATLAVSLEPPGGSPTGQPTGPVIATGELRPV